MDNDIVLVNDKDEAIGVMNKLLVHQKGILHRAFSIIILNDNGQMLIHQRHINKYHSGGLWSNACCSHPKKDEKTIDAAKRRLHEELNISCPLKHIFSFTYKVSFENNLIEHEFDHVFIGRTNQTPDFNTDEISNIKWLDIDLLLEKVKKEPYKFTFWFKLLMNDYFHKINKYLK